MPPDSFSFGFNDKVLMENKKLFTMHHFGRSGRITYQAGNNTAIPLKQQIEILHGLRSWTNNQKLRTDIDLPTGLSFEDIACAWSGCSEKRKKDSAYCIIHFDENLPRK